MNTDIKVLTILKYAKMFQVPRQAHLNKVSCLQVFVLRNVIFCNSLLLCHYFTNTSVFILKRFCAIKSSTDSSHDLTGLVPHKDFHINCQARARHAMLMFLSPQFYGLRKS